MNADHLPACGFTCVSESWLTKKIRLVEFNAEFKDGSAAAFAAAVWSVAGRREASVVGLAATKCTILSRTCTHPISSNICYTIQSIPHHCSGAASNLQTTSYMRPWSSRATSGCCRGGWVVVEERR